MDDLDFQENLLTINFPSLYRIRIERRSGDTSWVMAYDHRGTAFNFKTWRFDNDHAGFAIPITATQFASLVYLCNRPANG